MIVEKFLTAFSHILFYVFDLVGIPQFDALTVILQRDNVFLEFIAYAAYFLPMGTIGAILAVIIAEECFKICISCLKLFKYLPFM